jgi:hypothetical protein
MVTNGFVQKFSFYRLRTGSESWKSCGMPLKQCCIDETGHWYISYEGFLSNRTSGGGTRLGWLKDNLSLVQDYAQSNPLPTSYTTCRQFSLQFSSHENQCSCSHLLKMKASTHIIQ